MKSNFQDCLQRVFKDEGGYTNDPSDSGGPTKYGITLTDVRKYVKKNATAEDVKSLTVDQAAAIFKSKYWDSLSCDDLPAGVDYTCFDYGVNSGLGRPREALQQFKSLQGTELIDAINNERTAFLKGLSARQKKDQKFLNGWLARVQRVRGYSHYLATKVDTKTGPASGTAAGVSLFAALSHFVHAHPYLITSISFGTAVLLGTIIHLIRNK
jgi:lysozyme family protein